MKISGFLLVFIVGLSQAYAKTILIADIDDTLKNSHVLDRVDSVLNATAYGNTALGASEVFQLTKMTIPDLKFFYVTNAPKSLMEGNHKDFLSYNKYPSGALSLRESLFQSDFKVTEIRKILKAEKPTVVIQLGDDGEKDISVYDQITKEFPDIHFITYIRQAYSVRSNEEKGTALKPTQIGFVTSLDLILQFRKEGFVNSTDAVNFVRTFISAYENENEMNDNGPQALPAWMDCRDYQWTAKDFDLGMEAGYVKTKERILERCSIKPLED